MMQPMYRIYEKDWNGKWRMGRFSYPRDKALELAREMDEMGGCGPLKVVANDKSETIKI